MKSRFRSSVATSINLLLILLTLISACGGETEMPIRIEQNAGIEETIVTEQTAKEEPDEPTTIVEEEQIASIPDTTNLLDAEDTKRFHISIRDESVLTFPEPTEEELGALSIDEGDVLAIEPMEDAPDGLLRKVVEVVRSDGMIEVRTEQASLDEAIETGEVHETVTLREADLRESSLGHGVTLIKAGSAPSKDGFTLSIDKSFGDGDIKVSGTANIVPIFDFDMVIDGFSLKLLKLTNKTKITGTVKVTSDIATVGFKDEKELKKLSFKPRAFTVIIPILNKDKEFKIWVTPEVVVKVGVEGNLSAGITTQVKQEVTLESGLSCKGRSCDFFNNPIKGAFTYDPPTISATAEFRAYIGPHLNLTVFGQPGPFAAVDAYLKMKADPSRTPWWKLSAGVRGRVGVDFDIFSVIKFHWEKTLFEKEWTVPQAKSPPPTATAAPLAEAPPQGQVFGPVSGSLTHEGDGFVEYKRADVDLRDFVVVALFHNPYPTTEGSWDLGFFFRDLGTTDEFRLEIQSDGDWSLNDWRSADDVNPVGHGTISNLDVSADGANLLKLVALGDQGFFFVNGTFISELDLSSRTDSGDVSAATDLFERNVIDGEVTEYEDFTVWSLQPDFGPVNGSLTHEDDDTIEHKLAGVDLQDFIVEAVFYNPYSTAEGSWDFGFLFRNVGFDNQFRLEIQSDGDWSLNDWRSADDVNHVGRGTISNLDVSADGANLLKLVALGDQGFFFVNGTFISELELSSRTDSGDISAATDLFERNVIDGEVTEYEDFTVWSLP